MINVLMAASEGVPFAKTGGLADVIGSLPLALLDKGVDARVIMPLYGTILPEFREKMVFKKYIFVKVGWRQQYCGLFQCEHRGVKFYFLDNEYYFKRQGLYGYFDEAERYAYFCRAVLESIPHLDFVPHIIHCHDWQSGMIPVYLESGYKNSNIYEKISTLFTIHNLKYQGVFSCSILGDILGLEDEYNISDKLEFYGSISFMKGGLAYSKLLSTVSPTYAREIQYPYFGEKLDGLLRERCICLTGILNGIDYDEYNPSKDSLIHANYNMEDIKGKMLNKNRLQEVLRLDVSEDIPVIGIVTRLVSQKGLDLIGYALDEIIKSGAQIVILGTGDEIYERMLLDAESRYKGRISANIKFDNNLAHMIYAGADIFLMPSQFEPCGLGQIIALRYGTLPIVRETGGLKDTVRAFNEYTMEGNGFSFTKYNGDDMIYTIKRAITFYQNKYIWNKLVKNAMAYDYSWGSSALEYIKLYEKLKKL